MAKKTKAQIDAEKSAKQTAVVVEDALRNIADKVSSIFQEALSSTDNVSKAIAKDITGSLNSLAKVSKDLANASTKAAEGAFKQADATKLIQQRQAKIRAINYQIAALDKEQVKEKEKLTKELQKVQNYNEEFEKGLQEQLDYSKQFNKQLAGTGVILGGLSSLSEKIGLGALTDTFEEALSAAKQTVDVTGGLGNQFRVLGAALGSLGKNFLSFLTSPLAIIGQLVIAFKSLLSLGTTFAQKTADIGKSFLGMGRSSKAVVDNLKNMAAGDLFLNFQEARKALEGMNAAAGTQVMLSGQQVKAYQEYSHFLGLSEEATQGLFKISTLSGQSFDTVGDSIGGIVEGLNISNDSSISLNDVLNEVAGASATAMANIGNNPEALAKAAFEAKRLGMTLDQVAAAGEASLDFESSIANEMEAELLLGKNLNLEKLRSASLTGDETTVAKEMNRILSENYEATKGNKIAQQALAKTLGISVDEMHEMNRVQQLQNKLSHFGAEDRKKAEAEVNRLMAKGISEKEALAIIAKDGLETTIKEGKTAEAANRSLENAKEIFKNSLAPLAEKVAKAVELLVSNPTFQGFVSGIGKVIKKLSTFIAENPVMSAIAGGGAMLGGFLLKKTLGSGEPGSKNNPLFVRLAGAASSAMDFVGGGKLKGLGKGLKPGKMLKGAGKLAKGVLGKVAAPLAIGMALFDGFKGFNADKSASLGDKFKNAGSSALNGLSFGLLGSSASEISANASGGGITTPSAMASTTTPTATDSDVVVLLKELVSAVKEGGDVFIDGNKVGKSLALATSNMG